MIRWLKILLLFPIGVFAQTITLTPIGNQDVSGIPITVVHTQPGGTIGTITQMTNGIPSDRGQGTTTIFSSTNSDQGSVMVNIPSGYQPSIGGVTYSTGKLHANAWMAFPTTTYNSYSSSASAPNVPTLHFTSVNNGYTDNNMSHVSTETYNDPSLGDVFRIRYEGSYKYNVSGINTKIDIYFAKNNNKEILVVLRQFLADGSNIEQIGLSNGSSWIASNLISSGNYTSGQAWLIDNTVLQGTTDTLTTQNTNSLGQATFSNPNNYSYDVIIDVSQKFHLLSYDDLNYMMYKKANLSNVTDWDFYTLDLNNSSVFDWDDIIWGVSLVQNGTYHNKYIFTQSEKNTIENNPTTNYYNTYFPTQTRTISNENQFYIMGTGKHKTTISNLFKIN